MESFSIGTFVFGVIITILSAIFVGYHRNIADNLGGGVADYERYKKWGLIAVAVGIIVMLNLHRFILGFIIKAIFNTNS